MALKNETEIGSKHARLRELDAERAALIVCLGHLALLPSSGADSKICWGILLMQYSYSHRINKSKQMHMR